MGGWGGKNPWPFEWGGGETEYERTWQALRSAVGLRGAGPVDGLEDSWRQSKAAGLLLATTVYERAVLQAFPQVATDHIPVYESILGLSSSGSDEERRLAIVARWVQKLGAVWPELRAAVKKVDANLDLLVPTFSKSIVAQHGRWLKPSGGTPTFHATLGASQYPNLSEHFVVTVQWGGLASGVPPSDKLQALVDLLNERLPSWVDWRVINGTCFFLDGFGGSLLDLTAFC